MENIIFEVINYRKNRKELEKIANIKILDLAIIFREEESCNYLLKTEYEGKELFLWDKAKTYMLKNYPIVVNSVENILFGEIKPITPETLMLFTTNGLSFGVIFYTEVLQEICSKLETDSLYIIPSSKKEGIIMKRNIIDFPTQQIKQIIRQVNLTEVSEKDYLSDNLYLYDLNTNTISIAKEE